MMTNFIFGLNYSLKNDLCVSSIRRQRGQEDMDYKYTLNADMGESSRKFSLQESLLSGTKTALISALLTIHSPFHQTTDTLLLT